MTKYILMTNIYLVMGVHKNRKALFNLYIEFVIVDIP